MARSSLPSRRQIRDGAAIVLGAWGAVCLLSLAFVQYVAPAPLPGLLPDGLVCAGLMAIFTARRLWRD